MVAPSGLPEGFWEIVLVVATFVVLVAILVFTVDSHLQVTGHRSFLPARRSVSLLVVVVVFLGLTGFLGGLAPSAADPPPVRGDRSYEVRLRQILGQLRRQSERAYEAKGSLSKPAAYARSAYTLSGAYDEARASLAAIGKVRPGDLTLHSSLVERLDEMGEAYGRLGDLVADPAIDAAEIELAQRELRAAVKELRVAEEALAARGYRIVLADR
ncbi:MAG TPA: hypothetical protein VEW07_03580 [Solirubrobacterales bacterium]|nr:hypothetical protein [Solirubrobacterales bacterium]